MQTERAKLWTKDFVIVSTINFLVTLVFYLLMVTISVYAVEQFNAKTSEAGLVTGIFIIGALIGRLLTGGIIDKYGRKRILFIGLIVFTLTTILYFWINSLPFLLVNRLLHGIGLGIASTATGTIVAQIIPAERRGEGVGYFSLSATLATAIGPFFGIYLKQHTSFDVIFSFCLALGVISFLTAFLLKIKNDNQPIAAKTESKNFKISSFIEPKALPIAIIVMLAALGYSSVLSFITIYSEEIHLVEAASFFFVIYAAAILVSRPFTGRLLDLKGSNIIMYPCLLIFALGLLLLSFAGNGFTLLLAGAIIGLGFGNIQSTTQAIAVKVTPPHRIGLATATFFIFLDVGFGIGPYVLGMIIPLTGYRNLYLIMSILVLALLVLYYFMHGKKDSLEMRQRSRKPEQTELKQ